MPMPNATETEVTIVGYADANALDSYHWNCFGATEMLVGPSIWKERKYPSLKCKVTMHVTVEKIEE